MSEEITKKYYRLDTSKLALTPNDKEYLRTKPIFEKMFKNMLVEIIPHGTDFRLVCSAIGQILVTVIEAHSKDDNTIDGALLRIKFFNDMVTNVITDSFLMRQHKEKEDE